MTDTAPTATDGDASLEDITALPGFPDTAGAIAIEDTGDAISVWYPNDDQTVVHVHTADDGTARVAGVVRYTDDMPTVTPADTVYSQGEETRIVHAPGRETRVRDS
jgi:hypothetical protein